MTLVSDSCGGPSPLVTLANNYKLACTRDVSGFGEGNEVQSHLISDLLHHPRSEGEVGSGSASHQKEAVTSRCQSDTTLSQRIKSQNHSFAAFRDRLRAPLSTPNHQQSWQPQTWRSQNWRQQPWRPHQSRHVSQNKLFEEWIREFHPEVLQRVRGSEIVDVELSHDLAEEWLRDFHLSDVISPPNMQEAERIVENWIREFQQVMSPRGEEQDTRFEEQVVRNEKQLVRNEEQVVRNEELGEQVMRREYRYPSDGELSGTDIDSGVEMMKHGDLLSAISVFESRVTADPSCGEAWYYLGLCHQLSEREEQAITAFRRVTEDDECYSATLLGLAASYLNEHNHNKSLACLRQWLQISHPDTVAQEGVTELSTAADLRSCYATVSPTPQNDVELHTAMGILSCLLEEPGVAVDHFRAAIATSPHDFMLWNRLGATLANSDRSSESVTPYRRALSLSPGYTRARYNLGIACLNLHAYREGIEHFLVCLQQHDSDAVWQTLRLALSLDKQYSLLQHVDTKSLEELLRAFDILQLTTIDH